MLLIILLIVVIWSINCERYVDGFVFKGLNNRFLVFSMSYVVSCVMFFLVVELKDVRLVSFSLSLLKLFLLKFKRNLCFVFFVFLLVIVFVILCSLFESLFRKKYTILVNKYS